MSLVFCIVWNTRSLWFALHWDDVDMTSSCSHCVDDVITSDCDVIVTCVNIMIAVVAHDRQTLHMTGRPSHMMYRPWFGQQVDHV